MNKKNFALFPKKFLWRLTLVNFIIVTVAILFSSWAVYHTACFLADGLSGFTVIKQQRFSATLFQYLLLFGGIAVFISGVVQYYVTKKLIQPINQLISSTKMLKRGAYPAPLLVNTEDEIGELITHYNELIEQLHHNDQYRNKLVADVSHELRTPVANLTGYMHALKSGVLDGDEALFTALYEQSMRLTDLIEQIEHLNEWDTKEFQYLEKEKVDMKLVIQQCVQMFSLTLEQYELSTEVDVEQAEVFVHLDGIQQVLNNLLDNAIQYHEGEEPIKLTGCMDGDYYKIAVESLGDEIHLDEQARLFERFYRLDDSRNRDTGGTGLGLAIAKEIIESHDGSIDVISNHGVNTFYVSLPLGG